MMRAISVVLTGTLFWGKNTPPSCSSTARRTKEHRLVMLIMLRRLLTEGNTGLFSTSFFMVWKLPRQFLP